MTKIILTYLAVCIAINFGLAQKEQTDLGKTLFYNIKQLDIDFSIGKQVIPYSLLIEPTGEIDFEEGYDFSLEKIDTGRIRIIGKGKKQKVYNDIMVAVKGDNVELKSYFPPLNQDSTRFINGYDSEFSWSPHYEYEVGRSYILNGISADRLYQSNLDSIVRLVIPENANGKEINNIFQIDLKLRPLEIHFTRVQHDYDGNFEILHKGISYISKEKDLELFFKEFNELNLAQDSHFVKVNGSIQYLIEFKTKSTYFAGMRHYTDGEGGAPQNLFPWTVKYLYEKEQKTKKKNKKK